jgi:hypothetical protein
MNVWMIELMIPEAQATIQSSNEATERSRGEGRGQLPTAADCDALPEPTHARALVQPFPVSLNDPAYTKLCARVSALHIISKTSSIYAPELSHCLALHSTVAPTVDGYALLPLFGFAPLDPTCFSGDFGPVASM